MTTTKRAHPRTCAWLESIGIDPRWVSQEGFDHSGYFTYVVNASGERFFDPSTQGLKKEFHRWPSTDFAKRAVAMFLEEGGARA